MPIIAVTGRKGGIGKTTLAAHLAGEWFAQGREVALFDADPQRSLSLWAAMGAGMLNGRVFPLDAAQPAQFERTIRAVARRTVMVVVDTPPGFADPALLAALVADVVLVPCGPSPLDLLATREAVELLREVRPQRRDPWKPAILLVPNRLTASNLSRDLAASLKTFGEPVAPALRQRVAVAEAAMTGRTLAEMGASPARAEMQAVARAVSRILKER